MSVGLISFLVPDSLYSLSLKYLGTLGFMTHFYALLGDISVLLTCLLTCLLNSLSVVTSHADAAYSCTWYFSTNIKFWCYFSWLPLLPPQSGILLKSFQEIDLYSLAIDIHNLNELPRKWYISLLSCVWPLNMLQNICKQLHYITLPSFKKSHKLDSGKRNGSLM